MRFKAEFKKQQKETEFRKELRRYKDRRIKLLTKDEIRQTIDFLKETCEKCNFKNNCYLECRIKKIVEEWDRMLTDEFYLNKVRENLRNRTRRY